jgi:hypothetical protein
MNPNLHGKVQPPIDQPEKQKKKMQNEKNDFARKNADPAGIKTSCGVPKKAIDCEGKGGVVGDLGSEIGMIDTRNGDFTKNKVRAIANEVGIW